MKILPTPADNLGAVRPHGLRHPTFREAFRFWLKLGFISSAGPTGQIAIMHAELVEKKKWISEARFLHALNYCMLLPGPEAQQLATYVGWLLHKTWGGIVAGAFFVIPSIFILWALSYVYVSFGTIPWIAAIFYGLKPAVLAIVAAAVIQMSMACTGVPMTRGLDTPRVANDQRLSCSKAAPHRKVLTRARSKCIWMN
jgi:chromate transport protein ChrA